MRRNGEKCGEIKVRGDKAARRSRRREKGRGATSFVPRSREHSKDCGTADGQAASHSRLDPV